MSWFERLTGFREETGPDGYRATRSRLEVDGPFLRSKVNGRRYRIGTLELVSLESLRERAKAGPPIDGAATLRLIEAEAGALQLVMNDGQTENRWSSDPGLLTAGKAHHVAVIVDGGPRLILFVVDGVLCDGGNARTFGWGRFSPNLRHANGGADLRLDSESLLMLRVYSRALRVSEAISHSRAVG